MAIGKAFDTFAIIVRADTYFIRFMGPMALRRGRLLGRLYLCWLGLSI